MSTPRAININDLRDLAILAEGFKILTGQGVDFENETVGETDSLYVEIQEFIVKDIEGHVVGRFYFDHEYEDFYFLPAKLAKP